MTNVVIIGGGPGGFEAAFAARRLGADVTMIERVGMGGSAVLTDVVPSKALVSAGQTLARLADAKSIGLRLANGSDDLWSGVTVDMGAVNERIRRLAEQQSVDQATAITSAGVNLVRGRGRLAGAHDVVAETDDGGEQHFRADMVLVAVGAHPRVLATAQPDGERILTWAQLYSMTEKPRHLIVIGSGVTGAEFSSAYQALGIEVTLVSSRHQVLPSEDDDAAAAIQHAFEERGIHVVNDAHAEAVTRHGDDVVVRLADGRELAGSHCLVAVGSVPNTAGLGLEEAGVEMDGQGYITVDRVSRTSARDVYAAGDCTNAMKLASVASAQGCIAVGHGLGDSVTPLNTRAVASAVFTTPEIATVGVTQKDVDAGRIRIRSVMVPLATNARTKMRDSTGGFLKLFCLPTTHVIVGGVIVSFSASELIHSISIAVRNRLTAEQLADAFAVYPSLSGSIAEAARRLHGHADEDFILY